jgi:hypothetical protein
MPPGSSKPEPSELAGRCVEWTSGHTAAGCMPGLGLFGGAMVFAAWLVIAANPIFAWELTPAIWLIATGFNATAIASEPADPVTNEQLSAA